MLLFSGEIASLPDDIHLLHADCHRDADFLFPKKSSIDDSIYSDCESTHIGYVIEWFNLIGNAIISGH